MYTRVRLNNKEVLDISKDSVTSNSLLSGVRTYNKQGNLIYGNYDSSKDCEEPEININPETGEVTATEHGATATTFLTDLEPRLVSSNISSGKNIGGVIGNQTGYHAHEETFTVVLRFNQPSWSGNNFYETRILYCGDWGAGFMFNDITITDTNEVNYRNPNVSRDEWAVTLAPFGRSLRDSGDNLCVIYFFLPIDEKVDLHPRSVDLWSASASGLQILTSNVEDEPGIFLYPLTPTLETFDKPPKYNIWYGAHHFDAYTLIIDKEAIRKKHYCATSETLHSGGQTATIPGINIIAKY